MPTNQFKPFATGGAAAVESQAAYEAEAPNGRGSGILPKESYNKTARQGTSMAAAMGEFLVARGQNALDDGNTAALAAAIDAAIRAAAGAVSALPVANAAYNGDTGIRSLSVSLFLGVGTWLVDADAVAFASAFYSQTLTIDGAPVQEQPNYGDPEGAAFCFLTGFRQVVVTGAARNVLVGWTQQAGGTCFPTAVKAIAFKVA